MDKTLFTISCLLLLFGVSGSVVAQGMSSSGYRIDESYLGPGGTVESTSTSYKFGGTLGDTGVGESSSSTYRAQSGFNTTNDPRLSVVVNTSSINFGQLSAAAATTATATFSVLNYTAYGYSVFTIGSPPSNGGYTLTGMASAAPSSPGTEQYGINLKANTSPVTFGADPAQVPSSSFSYGTASTGYNTANNFKYVAGEKIAEATQTSGQTDYTISYIVNVSNTTPGGSYSGSQSLVVVGTY